jgi:hypothetical protein
MRALLLLIALCSCSSWPSQDPADHAYPQLKWCALKLRSIDGRTAWPVDYRDYLTVQDGVPTILSDDSIGISQVRPCPLGFVDRPLGITPATADLRVIVPWIDASGARHDSPRYIGRSWTVDELPREAVGAPVLRDVGDGYPPGRGGYDAVVGIVRTQTEVLGLDDLIAFAKERGLRPDYNLAILDGRGF